MNRGRHRKKSKNEKPMFNRLTINMYNEIKKCIETYYLSNDAGMPWRIVEDIKNQNNI